MKSNVLLATRDYVKGNLNLIVTFAASVLLVSLVSLAFTGTASAQTYASITAQAGPGARGLNVSNIQRFLASNPAFYPEALVTGYYGSLTQAAVKRFQAFYGIVSSGSPATTGYGRVGPTTMAKMNALIAGTVTGDFSAPYIYRPVVTVSQTGATITWSTDEPSTDRLYYDTTPIRFTEGDISSNNFVILSGQSGSTSADVSTSHTGTISGLAPNTTYYYLVVSKDASSNVSVSLPGATFRTNQ